MGLNILMPLISIIPQVQARQKNKALPQFSGFVLSPHIPLSPQHIFFHNMPVGRFLLP